MMPARRALIASLAASALAPLLALAQQGRDFRFSRLSPQQPVEAKGKIEVIEFFWYGCPHCYSLEPILDNWLKRLPPDAEFRRVPAVFNERWGRDAAIYYTLEAMNLVEKLHRPLFDAIHKERLRTDDPKALRGWLEKVGVEPQKFDDTSKSFGVQSRVRRAAQMSVAYQIDGTPAMAVHGRYTVSAEQGGSQVGMLQTVDHLIGLVRDGEKKK